MAFGEAARGLQDLRVAVLGAGDSPGTPVIIPGTRALSWNTESDSDRLEGGNKVLAVSRDAKTLSGSVELGLMNLAGVAAMTGGTVSTTGVTPNAETSMDEVASAGAIYCQIEGQTPSYDATGAGYGVKLLKCLVTSGPDEELSQANWNTPTLDFEGVPVNDVLLTRTQYETLVAYA